MDGLVLGGQGPQGGENNVMDMLMRAQQQHQPPPPPPPEAPLAPLAGLYSQPPMPQAQQGLLAQAQPGLLPQPPPAGAPAQVQLLQQQQQQLLRLLAAQQQQQQLPPQQQFSPAGPPPQQQQQQQQAQLQLLLQQRLLAAQQQRYMGTPGAGAAVMNPMVSLPMSVPPADAAAAASAAGQNPNAAPHVPKGRKPKQARRGDDELWECAFCGVLNAGGLNRCDSCGAAALAKSWTTRAAAAKLGLATGDRVRHAPKPKEALSITAPGEVVDAPKADAEAGAEPEASKEAL